MLEGDGDLAFYAWDNRAMDRKGENLPLYGGHGETRARLILARRPLMPLNGLAVLPSREVETHMLANAGARPWDRDAEDIRVLSLVAGGRGAIIGDEKEVSANPMV
ncbi:hypothetical protein [Sinorhizobium fredii]|uniref:hypothetical protein n=2 Tax=Rhizobium fredii TaxID=380 RepID=UPI0018E93DD8|nr:hypothetical protein [Sinorhizobium fredii]